MPIDIHTQRDVAVGEQIDAVLAEKNSLFDCAPSPFRILLVEEIGSALAVLSRSIETSPWAMKEIRLERAAMALNQFIEFGVLVESKLRVEPELVRLAAELLP
jgi:hypothetical protein